MIATMFDCLPRKGLLPSLLLLGLGACSTVGEPPKADASLGLIIANDKCAGCHQTGGSGDSPNPDAPTFREIADRPGMTGDTLAAFLKDGHNYPIEMGFRLEPHQAESLAAYLIRWRTE